MKWACKEVSTFIINTIMVHISSERTISQLHLGYRPIGSQDLSAVKTYRLSRPIDYQELWGSSGLDENMDEETSTMATFLVLCLSLFIGMARQATVPANVVEVYFVVDRSTVDRYVAENDGMEEDALDSLHADIDYFITEMNKLFASLEPKGLSIGVTQRALDILDDNIFGDFTDVTPGLQTFDAWLADQGAYAKYNYDAAILWTGFELMSDGSDSVAGYAHVGSVCKSANSTGIVEFDMTYHLAVTTAHEIGHILGASHDSDVTGYIMVPKSDSGEENRWDFSLCAREAFDAVMSKLSENCLLSTNAESTTPDADVTPDLADPDTICRRSENNEESYMCKSTFFYDDEVPSGDTVCKQIWCKDVGSSYCSDAFASDGLICGTNKRCLEGTCQDHPDVESAEVDESCIWGDQATVTFTTSDGQYVGDCPGFIDLKGSTICYSETVEASCCGTCWDVHTGIEGCEYGDQYSSCNQYTQEAICDNYADICCEFCNGYKKKRSAGDSCGDGVVTIDLTKVGGTVSDNLTPNPKTKTMKSKTRLFHEEA